MIGYDPIELHEKIEKKVVDGDRRKYYRFRGTKFYGGIATGDCVGCNLNCHYCWSKRPREKPEKTGKLHSPEEVSENLVDIARKENFDKVRLSGNEPTIGKEHLISLLEELESKGLMFILETNGITLGHSPEYVQELANFEDLHVRVSLKGCSPEDFHKLTGADPKGFKLQLGSLERLVENDISCNNNPQLCTHPPKELSKDWLKTT